MHSEFILKENVLTDDILLVPKNGKIFKGQFVAVIKSYSFANSWNDEETVHRFRSKERLLSFLDKNYPHADLDFNGTCLI
jgi:hypothetical protein